MVLCGIANLIQFELHCCCLEYTALLKSDKGLPLPVMFLSL